MRFIYTTLLFLFIALVGQSQTWNEWECCYDNDKTEFVSNRFLDNKIEMLGGKKKAGKLFQRKILFPFELKDTLCKICDSEFIRIRVYVKIDTLGRIEEMKVWCNQYPFVTKFVENVLKMYLPNFSPPVYKSKKVETEIYYLFALSTKEKIKNLKEQETPFKFYIYPVFGDLQNENK